MDLERIVPSESVNDKDTQIEFEHGFKWIDRRIEIIEAVAHSDQKVKNAKADALAVHAITLEEMKSNRNQMITEGMTAEAEKSAKSTKLIQSQIVMIEMRNQARKRLIQEESFLRIPTILTFTVPYMMVLKTIQKIALRRPIVQ